MLIYLARLLLALALAGCAPGQGIPPTATTPPRLTPESTATVSAYPTLTPHVFCQGTMASFLILGERGRVTLTEDGKWLNLRAGPGTDYDVIGRMAPLEDFLVLDGASCAGRYTWFQVDYNGALGWIAEGADGQYFAEPWLPG